MIYHVKRILSGCFYLALALLFFYPDKIASFQLEKYWNTISVGAGFFIAMIGMDDIANGIKSIMILPFYLNRKISIDKSIANFNERYCPMTIDYRLEDNLSVSQIIIKSGLEIYRMDCDHWDTIDETLSLLKIEKEFVCGQNNRQEDLGF